MTRFSPFGVGEMQQLLMAIMHTQRRGDLVPKGPGNLLEGLETEIGEALDARIAYEEGREIEIAHDRCPTCGSHVRVEVADEGTTYYRPDVDEAMVGRAIAAYHHIARQGMDEVTFEEAIREALMAALER